DGIRDLIVTGVQTCALPISMSADPDANLKKAVAKISEAAAAGAQLVCLPELFRSQYFAQREDPALFDLAEPIPGPSTEALGKARSEERRVGKECRARGWSDG